MDRDELRDEIAGWFFKNVDCKDPHYFPADKARYWADSILSLLAPVLADAEKWDRVKEIAGRNWLDGYPCEGCSVESMCDSSLSLCGQADSIVTALEGEGEKG